MATNNCNPIPVIMDVDTGMDDAQAIILGVMSPGIKMLGITCVSGNVSVDTACANTLKVLDAIGAPDIKVARGFSRPLIQKIDHCPSIMGIDGLGDLLPPLPTSSRKVISKNAVEFIIETLREAEEAITIIALAPLTNIAVAIRSAPDLLPKIKRIVWMGGALFGGGNSSAWAEANAYKDPEAAHIVLTCGVPITLYPWDVFLKLGLSIDEVNAFQKNITPSAASKLSRRLIERELRHYKTASALIGDAGAVTAVIAPHAMLFRKMHVAIELKGEHTRGMTVCDPRAFSFSDDESMNTPNVDCIVDFIDVNVAKKAFADVVLKSKI